ncbi:MAG: carboxypeptidase regulatory-like domain-containing protein [Ignavibacteria bacterium]|nr:carboxypeptidase regulatory-like domain-containing protein [Ignavibacteria bacterium]
MKAAISFFSVLVLTVLLSSGFTHEADTFAKEPAAPVCEIAGMSPWSLAPFTVRDINNNLVYSHHTTRSGSFRVPNLTPGMGYRIRVTFGGCSVQSGIVYCPREDLNLNMIICE